MHVMVDGKDTWEFTHSPPFHQHGGVVQWLKVPILVLDP